jgi:hypothetical protein
LASSKNIYSWDYQRNVRFEEVHYGLLVMIVSDGNGIVYDLWVHPASYHEVKSVGYRGFEYVYVCEDKPDKSVRQVVEALDSQIKLFNRVSRWRKGITLLAYLCGYAIGL